MAKPRGGSSGKRWVTFKLCWYRDGSSPAIHGGSQDHIPPLPLCGRTLWAKEACASFRSVYLFQQCHVVMRRHSCHIPIYPRLGLDARSKRTVSLRLPSAVWKLHSHNIPCHAKLLWLPSTLGDGAPLPQGDGAENRPANRANLRN